MIAPLESTLIIRKRGRWHHTYGKPPHHFKTIAMDAPTHEESPSLALWRAHYQWHEPGRVAEPSIEATWDRVALAVSKAETHQPDIWRERFRSILQDYRFLPGSQVLHGAGTTPDAGLSSCYGIAPTEDSVNGVFGALRESALALHAGAGIGLDFSHLHPRGSSATSPPYGTVSYMPLWREAADILQGADADPDCASIGLRCDHPDIEGYIDAYAGHDLHPLIHRTVFASDAFMEAVGRKTDWPLVFPLRRQPLTPHAKVCERQWAGGTQPQPCLVYKHVAATSLWTRLLQDEYVHASPRIVYMDTMQRANNLWYAEQISINSPCSSVPLPVGGACNRGSLNLSRFVLQPNSRHPQVDWPGLRLTSAVAIRFLDDVLDISAYPLHALSKSAHAARRLGLGITGLDSMFAKLGLHYGSQASLDLTDKIIQVVRDAAYQTSIEIAREKEPFPAYDRVRHAASPMVLKLPHELQDAIASHGLRNSHVLAVASDRRLDQLAGGLSHGIEPLGTSAASADAQLAMAAAVQFHVDNAVAVNIHVPAATSCTELGAILRRAWQLQLKNCRVVRARHNGAGVTAIETDPMRQ